MNDSGYAYAKASWIIGKSFLGKRISLLSNIHSLNDLDRLIFPDSRYELPGRELLPSLEERIKLRAVRQILSVIKSYTEPPKVLTRMIKGFEYSDLKDCFARIAAGDTTGENGKIKHPVISDIGRFKTIHFNAYPDAYAMIKKTEYEEILHKDKKAVEKGADLTAIDYKIDYKYYQSLIESLSLLDNEERIILSRLIADEISLRNCLWALRLRTYYQKSAIEVKKYLMDFKLLGNINQKRTHLASEALGSLYFQLDIRDDWRGWRWEKFLNQSEQSGGWNADPRHFQNAASQYLYHLAFHNFHTLPMSASSIYCFIKLKQFEEDLLTSIAEGLSLGINSAAVFKLLEHPEAY